MSPLSVLVVSCDRYADVWPAFFTLFWKYWPDCSYPIYLGANQQVYSDERVKMVLTGDDPSWAESTRRMVEAIDSPYILMLLEDFFFLEAVDSKQIESCFSAIQRLRGGYLRLKPFPKPDRKVPDHPEIGEIDHRAPYRSALQAAIWEKDVLLRLLVDGESAWDMELIGSNRSGSFAAGFYSTWHPAIVYKAGVTKGKWLPWAVDLCSQHNISIDLAQRPVMDQRDYRKQRQKKLIVSTVNMVPWQWRRPVGQILRRFGVLSTREST